jgi:hypothetical protein
MNKIVGIGIIGVGALALIELLRMKNVGDSISSQLINPRVHKVSLSGITLRTEVSVKNPTKDSMTITKPVVTLTSGEKLLTQSLPENKTYTIEPLGLTQIDTIELTISWTVIGSFVAGILKKIPAIIASHQEGKKVSLSSVLGIPIEMSFSTYANGIFFQSKPEKIL